MEILIPKITGCDEAMYYKGIIAYGKGIDGKAYVLRIEPEDQSTRWFVICRAKQTTVKHIFREDDETGEVIVFDNYDDAIKGFEYYLNEFCLTYDKP